MRDTENQGAGTGDAFSFALQAEDHRIGLPAGLFHDGIAGAWRSALGRRRPSFAGVEICLVAGAPALAAIAAILVAGEDRFN
jgi:hypothetical protein